MVDFPHTLDASTKQILQKAANTIRGLAMDGVQKADSGHPGLPLGCAELGAYLYGGYLRQNPQNPKWWNRDRFILSAGHGSMWLYACLHLSGYPLSLEDLKNFRQLHSKTPGHPESFLTEGVETTTGPLGQGVAHGVGQALGLKLLQARFGKELFSNKVFVLMGDGCMMEGISSEVSALAGHLKLDNFVLIYDANRISLDGPLAESSSEDTKLRYQAYGWDVLEIDGNDLDAIHEAFSFIRENQTKPYLVIARTLIGKGAPNKAGTHKVHGAPLGKEEVAAAKDALDIPQEDFFVPQPVRNYFQQCKQQGKLLEDAWNQQYHAWAKTHHELAKTLQTMQKKTLPPELEQELHALSIKAPISGRKASQEILQFLAQKLPGLYGGSADLSCSDMTMLQKFPIVSPGHYEGRNIKYGVREFGMAGIATGLAETGFILPYIGTFLTFSDYMRNAIRLAALQHVQVVYQFTHDSIFLGEDGPTHQPVEHYAALRAIPNLQVIRPADSFEVRMAWLAALRFSGPTALILSRQNIPDLPGTAIAYEEGLGKGAYCLKESQGAPDFILLATGSEVSLALDVAEALHKMGKQVRVVSMPCWRLFDQQPLAYRQALLGPNTAKKVSIEAGVELGWHKYIGQDGIAICMEQFGASAPADALAKEFGFTVEQILERIL